MVSKKNRRHSWPPGFTLIELLVVVAIIALLISILLPSLNRAKQQAQQLVCTTNLRSQGQAAYLYAEDNRTWLPRAMQAIDIQGMYPGYHSYSTAILSYLGWTGNKGLYLRPQMPNVDVVGDSLKLWKRPGEPTPFGEIDWWRVLLLVQYSMPQFQCAAYPVGGDRELDLQEQWDRMPDSPLDYVTSSFAIPYTTYNLGRDSGSLEWSGGGGWEGEPVDPLRASNVDYKWASKIDEFPSGASPASFIYVTESHVTVPFKNTGTTFHHFFLGHHLPFADLPRIANDQRHPGGLNALFFDGHAETLDLHEMDPGYPNDLDKRLKYFTVLPDDWRNYWSG